MRFSFRRPKPNPHGDEIKAIHDKLYNRIEEVSRTTAEANKSFDAVNELLEKGGFTEHFFLATPGGGKYMDKRKNK